MHVIKLKKILLNGNKNSIDLFKSNNLKFKQKFAWNLFFYYIF